MRSVCINARRLRPRWDDQDERPGPAARPLPRQRIRAGPKRAETVPQTRALSGSLAKGPLLEKEIVKPPIIVSFLTDILFRESREPTNG